MISCAVCGHKGSLMITKCGYVTATGADGQTVYLCRSEGHDCYQRWTVIEERAVAREARPIVNVELPESESRDIPVPEEEPVLEHISREVRAELPEEPPVGSVVLTPKGAAYQRSDRTFRGVAVWAARGSDFGEGESTWVMLLSTGPVYVLTDGASLEWVKRQREEASDG